MKLAFLTQNEGPFRMKWMDELAKHIEVDIYHVNEYERDLNLKYINYNTRRAKIIDASKKIHKWHIYDLKKICWNKYDIILLDGYGFLAQQILILYLCITRRKFILTIDGGFIPKKENFIKRHIKKFFINKANYYLSTSKETDAFLKHYGVESEKIFRHYFSSVSKFEVLSEPISIIEKKNIRYELGLEDKYTIIAVGKIIQRKGFDILLKAISKIDEDIQVLFVGAGDKSCIDKSFYSDDRIKIINFVNTEKLSDYYKCSDVFVLPTREDIWGLVIGEAMAKGLPVITTDRCLAGLAMIEQGVNGNIVPVEDVDMLANALKESLKFDQYLIGSNNIKKIFKYTIEESAKLDIENLKKIAID